MIAKKVLVIIILGPILLLASPFLIFHEYANQPAQAGQEIQSVYTDVYPANFDTAYTASLAASQRLPQNGTIVTSKRYDLIEFNSKRLNNNLWGAPAEEKLTSEVYLNKDKTFGWHWDRPEPLKKPDINCYQPIYPNIKIGGNPWEPSSIAYFPVKVSEIKTLRLDAGYSYPISPTGTYNLAYDMFFSDTNQASSHPKPKAEIMIWLQHTLQQPADAFKGDVTDGINTYEFYSFIMPNGRLYYAFVMKEQTSLKAQVTVNMGKLLDNLALDPDWYLHGVELGNEIVDGSGKIEINKINVNLNGHEL